MEKERERAKARAGGGYKSTLSGSTSSHGPRFKRYQVQANGVKVPESEHVSMVEDIGTCEIDLPEDCFFVAMEAGKAIVDSGATRTIVGEDVWKRWLEFYKGPKVKVNRHCRNFKFGGGESEKFFVLSMR